MRTPKVEAEYFTVEEIAAKLNLSKMTVYRLIRNGELTSIRVGRSFRVLKSDYDKYVERSKVN